MGSAGECIGVTYRWATPASRNNILSGCCNFTSVSSEIFFCSFVATSLFEGPKSYFSHSFLRARISNYTMEKKQWWLLFFHTVWYVMLIYCKFKPISGSCNCNPPPECVWFLCPACIEHNHILVFWWRSVIIKDHVPQVLHTQIIFWVQIRIYNFLSEWRVMLPYQTSVDTAISELHWMLHHSHFGFLLSKQFLLQHFSCLSAFGAWYSLLSVTGWMCYFQQCSSLP